MWGRGMEALHVWGCKCEGCDKKWSGFLYPAGMIPIPCPPPVDNTFDFTAITKQMRLNADILMQEMTEHAEKLKREISEAKNIKLTKL